VLRREDEATLERAPQPTLDQLPWLIEDVRAAGLPVHLRVEGEQRPLPPGIDLSAYRIIQEALTNSLRHAGPATATVTLRYGDSDLQVEVADDGRGAPAGIEANGGHGLAGMRERVALFRGDLRAGPRAGSGFLVSARLPLEPVAP